MLPAASKSSPQSQALLAAQGAASTHQFGAAVLALHASLKALQAVAVAVLGHVPTPLAVPPDYSPQEWLLGVIRVLVFPPSAQEAPAAGPARPHPQAMCVLKCRPFRPPQPLSGILTNDQVVTKV